MSKTRVRSLVLNMQKYNFFFKYKETNSLLSFFMNQEGDD